MVKSRGTRYAKCDFGNYEIHAKGNEAKQLQKEAVASLVDYAANPSKSIRRGKNVVLVGPKGTGKDHLIMALSKAVYYRCGLVAFWLNGCELQKKFKEAVTGGKCVQVVQYPPKILWLSDPIPPTGALSEFQQAELFALMDKRYSELLPTWITLNIADRSEGEARMGAQTFDRICHDALIVQTNWESYRQL